DARRPRVRGRQGAGRGRRARPGVPRRRRRVARRRVLDVPGHEPRPARAGGALGLDQQPQLPGTPGQGRPHAPRLAVRRRRDRPHREADRPRRPEGHGDRLMDAFVTHTGTAAPLRRSNVDTDQIIPAEYLKRITRSGFEDGLFQAWRTNEPDFVLNQPRFADIFRNNSTKSGLLTVLLPQADVEALWAAVEADPALRVTVDLNAKQVTYRDVTVTFEIDDYT